MNKKNFFYLGKITKTSGYKGTLVFFFDVDDTEKYTEIDAVFIDLYGELIPFVIRDIQFRKNKSAFVTLEDITSEEAAFALIGAELYLPLSFLPKLTGKQFYFHEIIGFQVIDKHYGNLGVVDRVFDQGSQPLLVVKQGKTEILIPATDEIITLLDRKQKTIEIEAPEGLIDIYLNK